jgi:hypothetical protein
MTDKLTDEAIAAIRDGCEGQVARKQPLTIVNPDTIRALATEVLEARALLAAKDAEIERLKKERDEAQSEMLAWRIAVQRLTPGGSEFTTPQSVIDWVVRVRADDFETKKRDVLAKRALAARVAELEGALASEKAERELLQDVLDSRPAINAGLPETYVRWSQAIYSGDFTRTALGRDGA